jgi:hypothetical protein
MKNMAGRKLQDATNNLEDPFFALGSARAALPKEPGRAVLTGIIGTTPRKSLVWYRQATDWPEFLSITEELFDLIESSLSGHRPIIPVFDNLAREIYDLTDVRGGIEVATLSPDDLPSIPGIDDGAREAAALLQRAILDVNSSPNSLRFTMDVGLDGSTTGTLGVSIKERDNGGFRLDIGFANEPSDLIPTRQILDALKHQELISIHFRSGHTFVAGGIYQRNPQVASFPQWQFEDFSNWNIKLEKPPRNRPQELHDAIYSNGDLSLFSWVVDNYAEGWLTCDDGSGEIADFIHVAPNGTLSMVHVKAVRRTGPRRRVAATPYEVVASQATKNLIYAEPSRLRQKLLHPPVSRPATWTDGKRENDRQAFLDAIDIRNVTDPVHIVIVQPHLSRRIYNEVQSNSDPSNPSDDFLRLCLLETILNSARASAVAVGADLRVIGRRD